MNVIIPASVSDAEAMAALYREVYPAAPGHAAGYGYPFPQYMKRDWFAKCLEGDNFYWLVAKRDDNLLGCIGAATDIGALRGDDRVAEFTGLIVREEWRRQGIGQSLLKAMCEALEDRVEFMLAETRTGNLGGWKGALKAGFIPLGFEPLAHNMLGRHEPMIMMGRVSPSAVKLRRLDYQTSSTAYRLGTRCLRALHLPMPPCRRVKPLRQESASTTLKSVGSTPGEYPHDSALAPGNRHDALVVNQVESSFCDVDWIDRTDPRDHSSGVLCLRRIMGINLGEIRFLEKCFVARVCGRVMGIAYVSVDLLDHRARVVGLHVQSQGLQSPFLNKIIDQLNAELARHGLVV
ncbi:MAG: GNAT family N-acetyltransferase, partial [Planctomycetota bacterium]